MAKAKPSILDTSAAPNEASVAGRMDRLEVFSQDGEVGADRCRCRCNEGQVPSKESDMKLGPVAPEREVSSLAVSLEYGRQSQQKCTVVFRIYETLHRDNIVV